MSNITTKKVGEAMSDIIFIDCGWFTEPTQDTNIEDDDE